MVAPLRVSKRETMTTGLTKVYKKSATIEYSSDQMTELGARTEHCPTAKTINGEISHKLPELEGGRVGSGEKGCRTTSRVRRS